MINIQAKSKLLLWAIIILMIMTIIISVLCCEHKSKRIIDETTYIKEMIEEDKRTIETETDKDGDTNQAIKPVSLGSFKLTAYCSCSLCCGKWANNRPVDENGNEIVRRV